MTDHMPGKGRVFLKHVDGGYNGGSGQARKGCGEGHKPWKPAVEENCPRGTCCREQPVLAAVTTVGSHKDSRGDRDARTCTH